MDDGRPASRALARPSRMVKRCGGLCAIRTATWFGIAALGLTAGRCSAVDELRHLVHGTAEPPRSSGTCSLSLRVVPENNIEIYLNDTLVAVRSPYRVDTLEAGEHRLLITAEGHHPFETPLILKDKHPVTLPISLRKRPEAQTR